MITYTTKGVCAKAIAFDVEDDILTACTFIGGCPGNTKAISKLVVGMKIDDVIEKLKGIPCRPDTSCPDQLAQALIEYKNNKI